MDLQLLGWHPFFEACFAEYRSEGCYAARVLRADRSLYKIIGADGEADAYLSAKQYFVDAGQETRPTTGDWVVADKNPDGPDRLKALLPRRSAFIRQSVRAEHHAAPQVVAANIDTVFIVAALDGTRNFNLRAIERYLTLAWNSGAQPVVLLNKSDLCKDLAPLIETAKAVAMGVDILALSAMNENVMEKLEPYLESGKSITLVGPSGVGKSTLINRLSGKEELKTGDVRDYDMRGRHTTTWKEMVFLPSGSVLIDTPGIRSIGLWGDEQGLEDTFPDILQIAKGCKFRDCSHDAEPNCAVRMAVQSGELDPDRVEAYILQRNELQQSGEQRKVATRQKMKNIAKQQKLFNKISPKRR